MINRTGEYTDLTYIGDEPEVYGQNGYKMLLEDKSEKKGITPLAEFIKFIDVQLQTPVSNNTDDEKEIAAEWGKYINVEAFLRK
jgi:spore coat protein CotH